MSAQTFTTIVAGTTTFQSFRENYNNVASEMNTGVLRLNGPAVVGNATLNGSATFSQPLQLISTFVVNSATFQQNTTNRLENRGGVLFFNGERVRRINEYSVYGYASGGISTNRVTTTDRTTFSTSTTAAHTPANLSQARGEAAGISDTKIYGYVIAGSTALFTPVVTADRLTFSSSTSAASTPTNASQAREALTGISDGVVFGYALGGSTGSGVAVATTDRINFSSSILSAHTPANLPTVRYGLSSVSDGTIYGYTLGGFSSTYTSTADRITFSTSTIAAHTPANLSTARYYSASVSDAAIYGYVMGGVSIGENVVTTERITFSTSTTAAHTPANLTVALFGIAGVSGRDTYGYIFGTDADATSHRLTFSTSTTAAHTPANLSVARQRYATISDGTV